MAGQLIAGGARSSLEANSSTYQSDSKSNALTLTLSVHKSKPSALAGTGTGGEAASRRRAPPSRTAATVVGPSGLATRGVIGANRAARRKFNVALGAEPRADVTPFERRG